MQVKPFTKWRERIARRFETRREERLQRKVVASDDKTVAELRVQIIKIKREYGKEIQRLRGIVTAANKELRKVRRLAEEDRESLQTQIRALKSTVDVQGHENNLLAAVHQRDIARREAEAAVLLNKAEQSRRYPEITDDDPL